MQNLKKGAFWRLFLFLAGICPVHSHAGTVCPAGHPVDNALVSYVHDGDTVHLQDGRKIRLIGINAPELARDDLPAQPFAREAREALAKTVSLHGNRVGLVYGVDRYDRYKRTLAHLFTPDGENLQAVLLRQGMAVAITHPPNSRYSGCYAIQELHARCDGEGIWSNPELAITPAEELDAASKGFHLVSGTVEQVSQTGKGVWLFMAELMLGIHRENLDEFDMQELLALPGKQLTVRGWLQPGSAKQAKKKFRDGRTVVHYMRIRHPSALEVKQTDSGTKCNNISLH